MQTKNAIENVVYLESKLRNMVCRLQSESKAGKQVTTTTLRDVTRARKQLRLIHERIQRLEADARRMLESWT